MEIESLNISRVGEATENPRDVLISRAQSSLLGRFYQKQLKHISFVRTFVLWGWRTLCPLYLNFMETFFFSTQSRKWRPLIRQAQYVLQHHNVNYELAKGTTVETPAPQAFPVGAQSYLVSPHDRYDFPAVYVTKLDKGITYGGTNLVLAGDDVVCHDLYDFKRDYTSEERRTRTLIDPKLGRIRWLVCDEDPAPIPVAASFVDACSYNYAHWLTEVLPRIALFCADTRFQNVPIVVDEGLHPNIMESLAYIVGGERKIIMLSFWRALAVDQLYMTSVAGYVPFERRTNGMSGHSQGKFSPQAFKLINDCVMAASQKNISGQSWPEKIFVRRNSPARKVVNAAEIEAFMVSKGYAVVEPEKLTFLQQVQLFSNAKTIVGATGAAMANIIFAHKDAKIFILINKTPRVSYWYWQNMACALGKTVTYVLGDVKCPGSQDIHADFTIDLRALSDALGEK